MLNLVVVHLLLLNSLSCNSCVQCDQMPRFFVQYLAVYSNENFPSSIKMCKVGSDFCQILYKPSKNYQRLQKLAKVVEFLPNLFPLVVYLGMVMNRP